MFLVEQFEYPSDIQDYADYFNDTLYLGNASISLSTINRNKGYSGINMTHPDITKYTYFGLKDYFLIFFGIGILHTLFIFYVKKMISNDFAKLNLFEQLIHAFENIHFPFPVHDWDYEKGKCEANKRRMKANMKEVFIIIITNLFFNFILLFPLIIQSNFQNFLNFLVSNVVFPRSLCATKA